jgi:hypothetical protein
MNIVVLTGVVTRAATSRLLAGRPVVELDVAAAPASGERTAVNVVWPDGEAAAAPEPGAEVVIAGYVRRRFFRAGGSTVRSTEVVATGLVPAADRRRARRLVDRALSAP